ncbi:DUF58 domain-containing protein [Tomitella cavernea]|uniref:DUF58 domain-containing protein n=1 Tax=Tomitella cavernea TaxID=1387982 RepID=A0ABP9CR49_9ACTN|nr:DUF58 domain-containing protein [Tomitella cavernea]
MTGQASRAAARGGPPSFARGELEDPALSAALHTLELTVRRRLDGLLHGDYHGLIPGPGTEPGDAREYQPGDDVRLMDWSVTARTTVPHMRMPIADRELETSLVVDLSASLDFGTAHCEKRDLAVAACAAITYLTLRGGNRIGAVIDTGSERIRIPARSGRVHARTLLRAIATTQRPADGVRGDLAGAIESLRRRRSRRGLVVVVSDFLGDPDWERPLRGIAAANDVLGVEVLDPRDIALPDVGTVILRDPESGRTREFTTTAKVRSDFAAASAAHRDVVSRVFRSNGAPMLRLRTDRDWMADTARFVATRRRLDAGAMATSAPGAEAAL